MWLSKESLLSIFIPNISIELFTGKLKLCSVFPRIRAWCFFSWTIMPLFFTVPSSFSYSSLSETAGACDWQHVRTQREKKLVICSDVRHSELENIRLAVSSLWLSLSLRLALEFPAAAGVNVKAMYTAPTRKDCMASTIWLSVSTSWPSHYNSKTGLDRFHLPRNLIFALSPWESIPFHSKCTIDFPRLSLRQSPKK